MNPRARRRRRSLVIAGLVVLAMVLIGVDFVRNKDKERPISPAYAATNHGDTPEGEGETKPSTLPRHEAAANQPHVVEQGAGTFTRAPGGTDVVGKGQINSYQIMVEDGIEQDPADFARAVDSTLAEPRGWTAGGDIAFQRIDSGTPQFFIYLASPKTVDQLCAPLDTGGYTSCRVGNRVVINVARWLLAVPEFGDDLATYRLYVINHEVGHRLGHGHESCPGSGQLAPVMQQQTLGLNGCRPNPWPYVDGHRYAGAPTA